MQPTNRIYKNIETKEVFRLYECQITHKNVLINEKTGQNINSFLLLSFAGNIIYKLNNSKLIVLNSGEFYHLKHDEKPLFQKIAGVQKRFVKL